MGRWHAHAARHAGAEVVAVADLDGEAARAIADGAPTFDGIGPLLGATTPDVVHLCTPLATHGVLARQALNAGCHVLVEKPLVPDAAETEALLALAGASGRLLCPVHQFPFQDGARQARASLSGLGRLVRVEATFCSAGAEGAHTDAPDAVVADVLPHPISLIQALVPGALDGASWTTAHPAPGELLATAELGGALATIRVSMAARPTEALFRLGGSEGSVTLDLFHGFATVEPGAVSRRRKITLPFERAARQAATAGANLARRAVRKEPAYPGLRTLVRTFYDACMGDHPAPISARAIVQAARLRDDLIAQAGLSSSAQ